MSDLPPPPAPLVLPSDGSFLSMMMKNQAVESSLPKGLPPTPASGLPPNFTPTDAKPMIPPPPARIGETPVLENDGSFLEQMLRKQEEQNKKENVRLQAIQAENLKREQAAVAKANRNYSTKLVSNAFADDDSDSDSSEEESTLPQGGDSSETLSIIEASLNKQQHTTILKTALHIASSVTPQAVKDALIKRAKQGDSRIAFLLDPTTKAGRVFNYHLAGEMAKRDIRDADNMNAMATVRSGINSSHGRSCGGGGGSNSNSSSSYGPSDPKKRRVETADDALATSGNAASFVIDRGGDSGGRGA